LVTRLEEPHDVTLLGLVVVDVDLRPQLHFLDHGVGLVTAALPLLLRGLVLELAVVHELGDRRPCHRGDFHQIKLSLTRQAQGVFDAYDPYLLSGGPDESDLGDANAIVDSRFGADMSSNWL